MKLALSLGMTLAAGVAEAGPWCGLTQTFAPGEDSTLPVAPTIALHVDHQYYDGKFAQTARVPKVRATIDGKRVAFSTRDVRTSDGVIRFITLKSRATGKLALQTWDHFGNEYIDHITYTIAKDWTAGTPTADVSRVLDNRLGVYGRVGHAVALRVDVPAIAFTVRWRKDARSKWRSTVVAAHINSDTESVAKPGSMREDKRQPWWGASEAWVGQALCGMVENVPLKTVEAGVEVELTATLPDGKRVRVRDGLPAALVMPPT